MLFNSGAFLFIFFPITLLFFYGLGRYNHRAAILFLAVASLVFYSIWDVRNLPIILSSITVCFYVSRRIQRLPSEMKAQRRRWMAVGIIFNLILLGTFKYADFLSINLLGLFTDHPPAPHLWLPIGISFYTFTQIAYLVDAAEGKAKEPSLVNYLAFVSYFPHQISGPIFHHSEMMPQFNNPAIFHPSSRRIAAGLWLASIGLFKKVIIADNLSVCAAAVFGYADHGHPLPFFSAWIGALAYTGQIYFDFSGYTDMALGISTLLGIKMPINFNSPYHSKSIIEFWRRWHMTLSRFLRDYLYIPLGGNRKGRVRRYVNLMVTMVLGGLWHGAGWTFLMWGTLHGIYLCINHAWRYLTEQSKLVLLCPEWLRNFSAWAATFLSVVVAWVFFRAKTFAGAFVVLKGMAGLTGIAWPPYFGPHVAQYLPTIVNGENWLGPITDIFIPALMVLVLFASFALPNSQAILRGLGTSLNGDKNYDNGWFNPSRIPLYVWALFFGLICGAGLAMMGGLSEFLYFNF